jgi:hypothetical protein
LDHRNLRMLVVDDNSISENPPLGIDMIKVGSPNIPVPLPRIAGWMQHCDNIANTKELEFDLLSDDVNFDTDRTDPQNVLGMRGVNASGLYHGMMALARRRTLDEIGNSLPLAWEIRSISPEIFASNSTIEIESIRAYGLLRSSLAEPEKDESLIDCIIREHLVKHNPSPSEEDLKEIEKAKQSGLIGVMRWDLMNQPQLTGAGMGAASRLLSLWRAEFLRHVKAHKINVDVDILTLEKERLAKFSEVDPLMDVEAQDVIPVIPFAGWKVVGHYGIRLWSIMADLILDNRIDVRAVSPRLKNYRNQACSVLDWLMEVMELNGIPGGTKDFHSYFVRLAKRVHDWAESGASDPPSFWSASGNVWGYWNQAMIYCIMLTRSQLLSRPVFDACDKRIATALNLTSHEHTFRRAFVNTKFGGCDNPRQFRQALSDAFDGSSPYLFAQLPWLKESLQKFCKEVNVPESTLKKRAQGLL